MARSNIMTQNPTWGFWGAAGHNGYDVQMTWDACADALTTAFDLPSSDIRDLLDARFGRHLADDLSFIPGGPQSRKAVTRHLQMRLADAGWRRWFEASIKEVKAELAA